MKVRTVNIKDGLPLVEEGKQRLASALARARCDGVELIRVIHGWGSSGTGGRLGKACRRQCERWVQDKVIARYCPGEEYGKGRLVTQEWIRRYPELKRSILTDTENHGITFVELPSRKKVLKVAATSSSPSINIILGDGDVAATFNAPPATKVGNPKVVRLTPPKARKLLRKTVKGFEEL